MSSNDKPKALRYIIHLFSFSLTLMGKIPSAKGDPLCPTEDHQSVPQLCHETLIEVRIPQRVGHS